MGPVAEKTARAQPGCSPSREPEPAVVGLRVLFGAFFFFFLFPFLFLFFFSTAESSAWSSRRCRAARSSSCSAGPVPRGEAPAEAAMRLIQNMCTIAEYPAPGSAAAADFCLGAAGRRLVKIAVVGASGVGKTGESSRSGENPLNSLSGVRRPPLAVSTKPGLE